MTGDLEKKSVTVYPEQLTVALFRKRVQLKNIIENTILSNEKSGGECVMESLLRVHLK